MGLSSADDPATIKVHARDFKVGTKVKAGNEQKCITHIFENLLYADSAVGFEIQRGSRNRK